MGVTALPYASILAGMSVPVARKLRKRLTDAERRIWSRLRLRQLDGMKFRRQAPIDQYVVDFLCLEKRLIVEIDGGQHTVQSDKERTDWLESQGFTIVRIWNNEALQNTEGAVERIPRRLRAGPPPTPARPRKGGGALTRPPRCSGVEQPHTAITSTSAPCPHPR